MATVPGRRSQEERRRDTTNSLMDAWIALLFEQGYAALTMANVAERAGVSRGALNHYYATKEQLVVAATHHAMEIELEQIDEAALPGLSRGEAIDTFLDASERFYLSKNFIAQMELVLAGRNDVAISGEYFPLIERYRERFDATWQQVLMATEMPADEANELITMTNITFRGLALTQAREPGSAAQAPFLRKQIHRLFNQPQETP